MVGTLDLHLSTSIMREVFDKLFNKKKVIAMLNDGSMPPCHDDMDLLRRTLFLIHFPTKRAKKLVLTQ